MLHYGVQSFASSFHNKRITLCKFFLPELSVEQFILKFDFPFVRVLENKTYPLRAGIQIESWQ